MSVSLDAIVIMVKQWSMIPGANERNIFCHALLKERGGLVQLMKVNNPNPTRFLSLTALISFTPTIYYYKYHVFG